MGEVCKQQPACIQGAALGLHNILLWLSESRLRIMSVVVDVLVSMIRSDMSCVRARQHMSRWHSSLPSETIWSEVASTLAAVGDESARESDWKLRLFHAYDASTNTAKTSLTDIEACLSVHS